MSGRISPKRRVAKSNVTEIPRQSGVYVLHRGTKSKYVGSAGAGRLQERIKEQLDNKRGITSSQYRTTRSEKEARKLEKQYRDRINPKQKRI